jgi:leucyl/phenylalanyl-tRNA--protein transferase
MKLTQLDPCNPEQAFPALHKALLDPNGLLAFGGCLSATRIVNAYQHGIFPWYNPGEPILWWSPNPRLVLFPEKLVVSRSLQKTLRKQLFEIRFDTDFAGVMAACAAPRQGSGGTWITGEIRDAYLNLHGQGIAHSVEAWRHGELVGGLYGLAIGQVFFGESMFHRQTDASKVAFVGLVQQLSAWGYQLIDCQVSSEHLLSLGGEDIDRTDFQARLSLLCNHLPRPEAWRK